MSPSQNSLICCQVKAVPLTPRMILFYLNVSGVPKWFTSIVPAGATSWPCIAQVVTETGSRIKPQERCPKRTETNLNAPVVKSVLATRLQNRVS
ncbi:hypothetical protein SBA6_100001 [Candidatus Sulfopaludibacter sp. SbA6]|nr:hypothetical protein SBA6_100001 [Candidatus Sulfopaludibacter sp. SbA6]